MDYTYRDKMSAFVLEAVSDIGNDYILDYM